MLGGQSARRRGGDRRGAPRGRRRPAWGLALPRCPRLDGETAGRGPRDAMASAFSRNAARRRPIRGRTYGGGTAARSGGGMPVDRPLRILAGLPADMAAICGGLPATAAVSRRIVNIISRRLKLSLRLISGRPDGSHSEYHDGRGPRRHRLPPPGGEEGARRTRASRSTGGGGRAFRKRRQGRPSGGRLEGAVVRSRLSDVPASIVMFYQWRAFQPTAKHANPAVSRSGRASCVGYL